MSETASLRMVLVHRIASSVDIENINDSEILTPSY